MTIIEIKDLTKHFPVPRGLVYEILHKFRNKREEEVVHAVCHVNMLIKKKEIFGLVGESGCGKTTLGRSILRLIEPTYGTVIFNGIDILGLNKNELRKIRPKMQMVFQDPFQSLNPRMRVEEIVGHPLELYNLTEKNERKKRAAELLELVELSPRFINKYPHQLSGGERQRVAIARALSTNPTFVVADESVSSLDVSVQAQILNKLKELRDKLKLTLLFISHDLGVVEYMSNRIGVMYLGEIVETGSAEQIFKSPKHPYTKALFSALPIPDPDLNRKRKKIILKGGVPNSIDPPLGCRFHTRCPHSFDLCSKEKPRIVKLGNEHSIACHLYA